MRNYALLRDHTVDGNYYHIIFQLLDPDEISNYAIWLRLTEKPLTWHECHAWIQLDMTCG